MCNIYNKQTTGTKKLKKWIFQILDKTCSQHDIDCGDYKSLAGRTASDKAMRDRPFETTYNSKYD